MKLDYKLFFFVIFFSSKSMSSTDGEMNFNPMFFNRQNNQDNIDLSAYKYLDRVAKGKYLADIYVNHQWSGKLQIEYVDISQSDHLTELCVTEKLLDVTGIDNSLFMRNEDLGSCLKVISTRKKLTNFDFSANDLRLDITIPQAYIITRPKGYVSSDLWEKGTSNASMAYSLNQFESKYHNKNISLGSLSINPTLNLNEFHFKHSGNLSWGREQDKKYSAYESFVQTDILSLRSQMKLGDVYASSSLFDSNSFRGFQLSSDDRMLPSSLRGYAPIINGYANTNSNVIVKQNGREILNTTIPAGPFSINDLYPTSTNGDLQVTVNGADGKTQHFVVPYSTVQDLIRPGFSQYELNIGKLRSGTMLFDENGVQGIWRYGINNYITANSGAIWGDNYQSGVLGAAFSTFLGAFSLDTTYAKARLNNNETRNGYSHRLSYSRRLSNIGTNISLAAYRYNSNGFYNWSEVAEINRHDYNFYQSYRPKEQIKLSLYQSLPFELGNMYVVANKTNYWNRGGHENSWSLGYSNNFRSLMYNVAINNSRYDYDNSWRKEVTLFISFPLDFGASNSAYANIQINKVKGESTSSNLGVSGAFGEQNKYSYGVSMNNSTNGSNSFNGNLSANTNLSKISTTYSRQRNVSQWSASASGAVVLHQGGITPVNQLGDTYAIVHAKDAEGAKILNGQNIHLDSNGYAIVPSLSPYEINTVSIDPKGIPLDIKLKATQQQVVPRANSAILIDFETSKGASKLLEFYSNINEPIPSGYTVNNKAGEMLAIIGAGGRALVENIEPKGDLVIISTRNEKICTINYDLEHSNGIMLKNGIKLIRLQCN